MEAVAGAAGTLSGLALERANAVMDGVQAPVEFDVEAGWARFEALMTGQDAKA